MQLLAIPKTEHRFEGPQIFRHCRHSVTCDNILQSILEEEFQKCFELCKNRLAKCIGVQADYFEGNSNH
jgi:putative component of membrane protein insertase Oxa1/YidC/SpoIIIJ protein YidD